MPAAESLVIQVGQAGNQIGSRFWSHCLAEHADPTVNPHARYDPPLATFFSNHGASTDSNSHIIHSLRARGIMVDMEVGVIHNAPPLLHELFALPHQRITATDGSGNNWAVGHHHYGPLFHDQLADSVRKQAEMCDALQSVFLIHSLGGGTGSGLGTYLAGMLRDEVLPEAYQFATVVAPSRTADDVVTSPYNAVLALHQLGEYADAVLPVDNEALAHACTPTGARATTARPAPGSSAKGAKPFDAMNDLVAQVLLNLTASMRFPGPLNVDINEISTNLVPFPRLKYLVSSLAPSLNANAAASPSLAADHLFASSFSRAAHLIHTPTDPRTTHTYLACATLVRSKTIQVSDIQRNIAKLTAGVGTPRVRFTWWNPDGWKTGLCRVTPAPAGTGTRHAMLALANSTLVGDLLSGLRQGFGRLYARRANVHHYTRYMDADAFKDAAHALDEVVAEYEHVRTDEGPQGILDPGGWERWARDIVRRDQSRVGAIL